MVDRPRSNLAARHLPLSEPVFQILLSIADQELHGYAIIQDVRARTDGDVDLTASTLYAAVKRLLDVELIEEIKPHQPGDDQRRRYYRITSLGLEVARLEAARLERTVRMARQKRLTPRKV